MCTDVDRNDKSRVCEPGSVKVIGRRQIEMYSRLIHTVDHIEGTLLPEFDALDAFLTHMWAVTVTGAPKTWAMRFIEQHEAGPRLRHGDRGARDVPPGASPAGHPRTRATRGTDDGPGPGRRARTRPRRSAGTGHEGPARRPRGLLRQHPCRLRAPPRCRGHHRPPRLRPVPVGPVRSEERRVGKEGSKRGWRDNMRGKRR